MAGRNFAPRAGVRRHRVAAFAPGEVTNVRGIPVTSVARTICDLAATEPAREVEHAFQEALYREIVTDRALAAIIEQTNVRLHGYLADACWRQHGLVVEFDGWRAHGHRLAFEANRKRDQIFLANGLRVLRVTDRQFEREPVAIAARIAMSLRG